MSMSASDLSLFAPSELDRLLSGFPPRTAAAGRRYAAEGRVRRMDVAADGRSLTAETKGTRPQPYRQRLLLAADLTREGVLSSSCTCPVGGWCKHVAAVLVAAAEAGKLSPTPATPSADAPLPAPIAAWLDELARSEAAVSEDYPASIRNRLFYIAALRTPPSGPPVLEIACLTVPLRKDGSFGTPRPYAPHQVDTPAAYLRPSDRAILQRLRRGTLSPDRPDAAEEPIDLLRRLIATGRARWGSLQGPTLHEAPARPGRIGWELQPDGSQRPVLQPGEGVLGFRLGGPWYADPATGALGPLDVGLPAPLAERLLAAPPVPAALAPRVAEALAGRLPDRRVPPPATLGPPETLRGPPLPHLHLTTLELPMARVIGGRWAGSVLQAIPVARLSFGYGKLRLSPAARGARDVHAHDGRLYRVVHDRAAEQAALGRLAGIGFVPARQHMVGYGAAAAGDALLLDEEGPDGADWLDVMIEEVPALKRDGWVVTVAADFPVHVVEPDGDLDAEWREGSGIDWFELHLGVMVDGARVDLVPGLTALLAGDHGAMLVEAADEVATIPVPLEDGRLLMLPAARLRPILEALVELFAGGGIDPAAGRIGFSRLDAAALLALEERSGLVWRGAETARALGQQLREGGGAIAPAPLPTSFAGTLRPYQAQGVAWLQFLRAASLGGVLADDMGLGKTVQALAHLAIEQAAGRLDRPALIVCPTSLVPNWTLEAARFAPTLRLLTLHGPARRAQFDAIPRHDIVLTTYPLLTRDHAVLTAQDWHMVVLDEAQMIRNPNAETTRQALRLQARQRICLSGTPLQNHLGELWSLFDFLAPGFLGSAAEFRRRYRTPVERHGDAARQQALARRVRPFLLRRTKDEVAKDLPPKTEITEAVEMEAGQRAIYESVRLAMHAKVRTAIAERGLARSSIIILEALLRMRQACCDPRLLKLAAAQHGKAGSAKLDRLLEMLATMREEGRSVLLFSQFTAMLALIAERLDKDRVPYVTLTGDTEDRATPVQRFQAGEVKLFLISLKAGGVGLNLTAADTVIHYDPWWNPAAEDQATDRAHRIGQTRHVFVHRLIALGSIEEKMQALKEKKRALVAAVLDADHGSALHLTEADVEELFAA